MTAERKIAKFILTLMGVDIVLFLLAQVGNSIIAPVAQESERLNILTQVSLAFCRFFGSNVLAVLFLLLCLWCLLFWILMLVDSLKRSFTNYREKVAWVLVILFVNFIGALIYWKMVYKKSIPK